MPWDLSQFHFIRPAFLLLLPVVLLLWAMTKRSLGHSGWENYLPRETIRALQVGGLKKANGWQWYFLIAPLVLCVAAAGPTWVKQPVPTLQNQRALVVLLDLSPSMLAQDLKPDRLTRAKYKLIDILRHYQDGQVALIAYAGDAHTVSPLTDDPNTLQALLPALHPSIMPSRGSNTEAAVALARQLLRDAKLSSGEVLLITDGVAASAAQTIVKELGSTITVSVLGVGSSEAAPIPTGSGRFLRGRDGQIILSRVNEAELKQLASQLGGRYARLNNGEEDVNYLIRDDFQADSSAEQALSDTRFDSWADMGHWFLLLVLPFAAWCFRRGFIYCLPLLFFAPMERTWADETLQVEVASDSVGDSSSKSSESFSWSHLWQTPDQRAKILIEQEQYADAAKTFEREDWRAIANYKNGDFSAAAKQLAGATDTTSLYNKGNALAMSGDLEQALKTYEQVLAIEPEHVDAQHNKKLVEQLMQQNQPQEQEGDQPESSEEDQESSEQESDQNKPSDEQNSQNSEPQDQTDPAEPQSDSEKGEEQEQSEPESTSSESKEQSDEAQEPEDESEQQAAEAEQQNQKSDSSADQESAEVTAEKFGEPLKDASEQWLRGIKDDPSGLLRRKFQYQAEQNKRSAPKSNSTEERY